MSRQHGVGRDNGGGAAYTAGDLDAVLGDLRLVAALVGLIHVRVVRAYFLGGIIFGVRVTAAVDLALGVQIVNDEENDVQDLGIGEILFVAVESREIRDAVLLQNIQQLQLGPRQLGLDGVHLTRKGDVDIRVGAGKNEKLVGEEQGGVHREGVRLGADEAGNGQAHRAVTVVDDLQLALFAGAFELDHVSRQIEQTHGAHNTASAIGTAVGYGGSFFIEKHSGFLPALRGFRNVWEWASRVSI